MVIRGLSIYLMESKIDELADTTHATRQEKKVAQAKEEEIKFRYLSESIDILIRWGNVRTFLGKTHLTKLGFSLLPQSLATTYKLTRWLNITFIRRRTFIVAHCSLSIGYTKY